MGVVLQKAVLFKRRDNTENLLWGREDATDEESLPCVGYFPGQGIYRYQGRGLDAPVAQGGKIFPGAEAASYHRHGALVRSPEILILDDSALHIDFATDARLRKAVRKWKDSPTVFLVSQGFLHPLCGSDHCNG